MKLSSVSRHKLIEEIISIISLEKSLTYNTKKAYKSDIKLMLYWFDNQNIDLIKATEDDFRKLFSFFKNSKKSKLYLPGPANAIVV